MTGLLWRFGHAASMEKDRTANRAYAGEWADSCSVGRPRKRWFDTMKDCLKKRGLDIRRVWRMV